MEFTSLPRVPSNNSTTMYPKPLISLIIEAPTLPAPKLKDEMNPKRV